MPTNTNSENLQQQIEQSKEIIKNIKTEIHKKIVNQEKLIDSILIAIFWKWHILIEWAPWLAKTLTVDTIAKVIDLSFNRIQFTPDLLPSDLIWTEIYNQKTWDFTIKKWPIFANLILADEINRSPSKVQSALLEAMAEKQVTIWNNSFELNPPFTVLATQNPIEQTWTYKLPEAQMDRFMIKIDISYQDKTIEKEIYKKINDNFEDIKITKVISKNEIIKIWEIIKNIYVSDNIFEYVTNIIDSTRNPENYNLSNIKKYIQYWISPRWWISLISSAKVKALMEWRDFVLPEDIKSLAHQTLSHRLLLSYEAIANNIHSHEIIDEILNKIPIV